MSLPTPPALSGLPLLGNILDYIRDPVALFRRGYETHGPIFSIRLGPKRAAVLLGPEYNRFFFNETDKSLSIQESYKWVIPMFGDKFPLVAESYDYKKHLPIYTLPFQGVKMHGYLVAMVQETLGWLDALGDEGEFELVETFQHLILLIAARAILGGEARHRLGNEICELYGEITRGDQSHLIRNLRLPSFRRQRAKLKLHSVLQEGIDERRLRLGKHEDFLQVLLEAKYPNGEPLPDSLIINLATGMVWANYPTTTGHTSWALIHLLQHPNYLACVLDEQEAALGNGTEFTMDTAGKLNRLEWALKETERLRPAVLLLGRYAIKPFELGGYRVPQGWLTLISPAVSHRLPDVFPEPDKYDPGRFSPERAEDRKAPFSLISFGGGPHTCLGKHFAYTEMKVILSLLLKRYTLELINPDPQPRGGPDPNRPKAPVTVRYRRR